MVRRALKAAIGPGGTSTGASITLRYTRDMKNPIRDLPTAKER
jgi:hypothetical protein